MACLWAGCESHLGPLLLTLPSCVQPPTCLQLLMQALLLPGCQGLCPAQHNLVDDYCTTYTTPSESPCKPKVHTLVVILAVVTVRHNQQERGRNPMGLQRESLLSRPYKAWKDTSIAFLHQAHMLPDKSTLQLAPV